MGGFLGGLGSLAADIGTDIAEHPGDYLYPAVGIARQTANDALAGGRSALAAGQRAWDEYLAGAVGGAPVANAAPMPTPPPPAPAFPGQPTWTPRNEVLRAEPSRPAGDASRSTMDEMLAEINGEPAPSVGFSWAGGARPTTNSTLYDPVTRNKVMGRESIGGGGFSPSQMDWSKVANPMAFEAFREAPALAGREAEVAKAEAAKSLGGALTEDPFARERTQGEIDVNKARGISGVQQEREEERRDSFYNRIAEMIDAEVARGIAQIQAHPNFVKMSPEQQRSVLDEAKRRGELAKKEALRQAFGIGQGLRVPELYQQDPIGTGG